MSYIVSSFASPVRYHSAFWGASPYRTYVRSPLRSYYAPWGHYSTLAPVRISGQCTQAPAEEEATEEVAEENTEEATEEVAEENTEEATEEVAAEENTCQRSSVVRCSPYRYFGGYYSPRRYFGGYYGARVWSPYRSVYGGYWGASRVYGSRFW